MAMFVNNMDAEEIANKLSAKQKDDLYRILWKEHVKEDVESELEQCDDEALESLSDEEMEAFVDQIATRYVYNGDYDCNLSYWDNIGNLISDGITFLEGRNPGHVGLELN